MDELNEIDVLVRKKRTEKRQIFTEGKFIYDKQSDTYTCPNGNSLKRKSLHANRQNIDYGAPKKTCAACGLRGQCTRNKSGRTVKRHLRQAELEIMRKATMTAASRQDIKMRQHLIERSFAKAIKPVSDVLYILEVLIMEFCWNFPMSFRLTEISH